MFRPVRDTLWFLRLLPAFSIVLLLVQYSHGKFHPYTKSSNQECLSGFPNLVKWHGGPTILTFNVSRLFGCIGLLLTAVCLEVRDLSDTRMLEIAHGMIPFYVRTGFSRIYQSSTDNCGQVYSLFVASASVFGDKWRISFSRHCFVLLLSALTVDVYRNIWPLVKYAGDPADAGEGPLLWVRFGLLMITAIIIPLFSPRKYVPVNPEV